MAHLTELQVENVKSHMMRDEDALKIKFNAKKTEFDTMKLKPMRRWDIPWFVLLLVRRRCLEKKIVVLVVLTPPTTTVSVREPEASTEPLSIVRASVGVPLI